MVLKKLEVLRPKTELDLDRCRELDKQEKLVHGLSYPEVTLHKSLRNPVEVSMLNKIARYRGEDLVEERKPRKSELKLMEDDRKTQWSRIKDGKMQLVRRRKGVTLVIIQPRR